MGALVLVMQWSEMRIRYVEMERLFFQEGAEDQDGKSCVGRSRVVKKTNRPMCDTVPDGPRIMQEIYHSSISYTAYGSLTAFLYLLPTGPDHCLAVTSSSQRLPSALQ
jgi:hypothetical protein